MNRKRFSVSVIAFLSLPLASAWSVPNGTEINPQEIALLMDNFLVDFDATTIGLLNRQNGNTHGFTTFTNRAVFSGQPANSLPVEPLASRVEWEAWNSTTLASIGGDDYIIDYKGFMFDTRTSPTDPQTYDVRWESKWYLNDPGRTATYAEGGGTWNYVDPDLSFSIKVDPLDPSNVTISGGGSATLWGVVDLEISGEKDFGTKKLTAKAGASVSVPIVSDVLSFFGFESALASGAFIFEYDQATGEYESRLEGQALFSLFEGQETVNSGRIRTPAKKTPPPPDPTPPPPPPEMTSDGLDNLTGDDTHEADGSWDPLDHIANVPFGAPPTIGGTLQNTFADTLNPFGDLANEISRLQPNQVFNPNTLFALPGFLDPMSHPTDSPIPTIAYSFQDPTLAFPGGGPLPGVHLSPTFLVDVPEPGGVVLVFIGVAALLAHRRRAA